MSKIPQTADASNGKDGPRADSGWGKSDARATDAYSNAEDDADDTARADSGWATYDAGMEYFLKFGR